MYNLPISLFVSNARLQIDSLKISLFNEYYQMCWYIDSILIFFFSFLALYFMTMSESIGGKWDEVEHHVLMQLNKKKSIKWILFIRFLTYILKIYCHCSFFFSSFVLYTHSIYYVHLHTIDTKRKCLRIFFPYFLFYAIKCAIMFTIDDWYDFYWG